MKQLQQSILFLVIGRIFRSTSNIDLGIFAILGKQYFYYITSL